MEGNQIDCEPENVNAISAQLIANDGCRNVKMLGDTVEPATFNMVENEGEEIEVFGVPIRLPKKTVYFSSVIPKIEGDTAGIKEGDLFTLVLEPQDGFALAMTYD